MATATIMLTRFEEIPPSEQAPDGSFVVIYTLNGGGGNGTVWPGRQAMLDYTVNKLTDDEHAVAFLMGYWYGRDPNFSNPNIMLNKTLTIDFSAPNAVKLQ